MLSARRFAGLLAGALLLSGPLPLAATDGHFLHGVGAVNASLGGTGIAGATDAIGAMYHNPAGLMAFPGNRVDLSFELFRADRTVSSDAGAFGAGSTVSKKAWVPIPAFGWSSMLDNGKVVLALGGLGIGGFGVDYPQDNANPILAPQPNGFGQVYSDFQLMKISPSAAFAPSEKLWLGVAANLDWASLSVMPMPAAAPDVNMADGSAYYPQAAAADGAFGFGFQAGLIYNVNDLLSLGAAYTSTQAFQDFEFNSMHANPGLPDYNTNRTFKFGLDVPAVLGGGINLRALPNLLLLGDVRYVFYSSTAGFDKKGFDATGAVQGFGWDDIMVVALGAEYKPSQAVALRAGYNHSDNPVPDDQAFFNVAAPAIVQDHLTLGMGWAPTRRFAVNLGYYRAFEGKVAGEMWGPTGPMPGSLVSTVMTEDSFQIGFAIATRGEIF